MNYKLTSVVLILFSGIPFYLSFFQFLNDSIQWSMIWSNEATFWGVLFFVFDIAGFFIAFKQRSNHPIFAVIATIMAILVFVPTLTDLISKGFGQSSKGDSETLELLQFWLSGWWK